MLNLIQSQAKKKKNVESLDWPVPLFSTGSWEHIPWNLARWRGVAEFCSKEGWRNDLWVDNKNLQQMQKLPDIFIFHSFNKYFLGAY